MADAAHTWRERRHGFKIALDDFRTGYSGIVRLTELRPDTAKLDRAVVTDCDRDKTALKNRGEHGITARS